MSDGATRENETYKLAKAPLCPKGHGWLNLDGSCSACARAEPPPASGVEARVCEDIAARQRFGIAKYGTTIEDAGMNLPTLLQHAYEESLDLPNYLKAAIESLTDWQARAELAEKREALYQLEAGCHKEMSDKLKKELEASQAEVVRLRKVIQQIYGINGVADFHNAKIDTICSQALSPAHKGGEG